MRAPLPVVTMGETMALLGVPYDGRTAKAVGPTLGIGGAESNVAIGLSRLGVGALWIGRVGDDALGRAVLREIRAEGVTVLADRDPAAPTGVMVKELHRGRARRVRYYRTGSAGSRLGVADVERAAEAIAAASVLHLTGITPALGAAPRAAFDRAVRIARESGTAVSFDVNDRRTLWPACEATRVLSGLIGDTNVVFAGVAEAELVLGRAAGAPTSAEQRVQYGLELAAALAARGPATAVLKLGALGSVAVADGGAVVARTRPVEVVDAVGAGDAFVAGYLARSVAGTSVADALAAGNLLGGIVCGVPGDWEGLPYAEDLADDLADDPAGPCDGEIGR